MQRSRWSLMVVFAALVGAALIMGPPKPESIQWLIAARFPYVSWVDADTLAAWMKHDAKRNLLLLDVRTEEEYAVSHLRGAVQMDPDGHGLSELSIPDDATVVAYCSVGYRSGAIIEELRERGVEQVYNLTGGIFGWANAGRPLFRHDARVELVHPYDSVWGLLLRKDLRAD
ncbi:MAG: rhodanese-like domain-containing protein [Deltaproteobacteria bacterium]|nr:rhodanese-like domain-containing protein [Deltaproteobacteria bacterium]